MLKATDLKNGVAFMHHEKPYQVTKYALIKMGRGGAVVKVTARNLESGSNEEISYSSNNTVEEANTHKRSLQYLYKDGTTAFFMDERSYEQVEVPLTVLGDQIYFVKEGETVSVFFWEDKALWVDLPPKVVMTVVDTDPGVKGNSTSNMYKSATLDNGFKTKIPLFIDKGEKIRVDTRTGEYIERAKV
jgi:elongation factor P